MQILIVEDEKRLASALAEILKGQKYNVDIAYDGRDGLAYAENATYDLMIFDVMLPEMNGLELTKILRDQKNATPILMLTARGEIGDKVKGLDSGADDYMTKPFEPEELLARVRALSRRPGEFISEELDFGDLTLATSSSTLYCGDKSIQLSFKELEILKILMLAGETITSKETFIVKVWGADSDAEDNNVEAYISFLRKKFYVLGSTVGITSVRRLGYRLEDNRS